jgi:hypothetical protein
MSTRSWTMDWMPTSYSSSMVAGQDVEESEGEEQD